MSEDIKKAQIQPIGMRLSAALHWTKTSYYMLSGFFVLLFLIGYIWWPLVLAYVSTYNPNYPFWIQFDWLLLGNFLVMSLLIMTHADFKIDLPIILVGFAGGLVIESWGTQTWLWTYYTAERPPLWIIPAWPIASLAIDRLYRTIRHILEKIPEGVFIWLHWLIFPAFYLIMLLFIWPTLDKSLTQMALLLCAFLILTPRDYRGGVLTFIAGTALGYFLELWGTTRECWVYYTRQTPPFFAVLAHGMAAVAFWRVVQLIKLFLPHLVSYLFNNREGVNSSQSPDLS